MLCSEQIKNHRRSIEKTKKACGWYGPSGVGGIDYSKERFPTNHISFAEALEMIDRDQKKIAELEEESKDNTGLFLQIAINYGGRDEMIRMMRRMADDVKSEKI